MAGCFEFVVGGLIIGGIIGTVIGFSIAKKFNKEEWTTDDCLKYLGERGYRVNLNIGEGRKL